MFTKTVEELMTRVTSIDFAQPWYRCVATNMGNTGMALGGIGTAVTGTPAGTTPCFHFYNGCGIENDGDQAIELTNYFYGEVLSDDLTLLIRTMSFFQEDIVAFPLFDAHGEKYFRGDESEEQSLKILKRIISSPTFVDDNHENLSNWGLLDAERNGTLHLARKGGDHRFRNFSFLLNIFSFSVTRNVEYTRSLIANLKTSHRLAKECYPSDRMLYEFQYPLSYTHYREETQRCVVKKVHITSMCPGNERLCSMPAFMTNFIVTNPTNQSLDASFILSVENFIGYDLVKTRPGLQDALLHFQRSYKQQKGRTYGEMSGSRKVHGLIFHQDGDAPRGDIRGELCFAIATEPDDGILVTANANYFVASEANVVEAGIATGKIHDANDDAVSFTGKEPLCGALCATMRLMPGETKSFSVVTVMDLPHVEVGEHEALKKYTTFFPQAEDRSRAIAKYLFDNRDRIYVSEWAWRESMHQKAILDTGAIDQRVAGMLRQLLVDHVAFIAESSVWDAGDRFRVRECVDYPFFNSLDVYFYGSFGLLKLLPQIDNKIVREFAETILREDLRPKLFGLFVRYRDERVSKSLRGVRKVMGSTPHDMGTPFDADANAYSWKDVAAWVDLAPKFVMLVYRNFLATRDFTLLEECWPAVVSALEYVRANFIDDEGDLPISSGYANTFDNLRGDGICIYPASLWIAGLHAAGAIADLLGQKSQATTYAAAASRGRSRLKAALWDEQAGLYLYSVSTVRRAHVDADALARRHASADGRLVRLLEAIGHAGTEAIDVASFVRSINAFVDDDGAIVRREHLVGIESSMGAEDSLALAQILAQSKIERRRLKKRFVHVSAPDLFVRDFEALAMAPECEHVFANQLCADTYLYHLDLPEITDLEDRRRVLANILAQNMRGCARRVGASNMVARGGKDLDIHQAQEVWLGVQYTLAGALVSVGMIEEFEELIAALFDAIYIDAKIPFGIPEGFNCVGIFIAEDLVRAGIEDKDLRAEIVGCLKRRGILSPNNLVSFAAIEDAAEFAEQWDDDGNEYAEHVSGEALHELLMATRLKYTAGRYFRAGMVHILPEILRKYSNSNSQGPSVESCLALLRTATAGALLQTA
jgi:non-lysosomal glucosylceramidase